MVENPVDVGVPGGFLEAQLFKSLLVAASGAQQLHEGDARGSLGGTQLCAQVQLGIVCVFRAIGLSPQPLLLLHGGSLHQVE